MTTELRKLPGVDTLLEHENIKPLVDRYGRELVVFSARQTLDQVRAAVKQGGKAPRSDTVAGRVVERLRATAEPSLKRVINATGTALHTNLGRAPLGSAVLQSLAPIVEGYSNVEFDLATGRRGHRDAHVAEILTFLTGADDAVVVNNNAAGIILTLSTLAKNREVIISRGELIEIGGAFRIPDIMAAAGARMVEVGTTNRTRLADYENAITGTTALLFKAHKSNYAISGFTQEVPVNELAALAHARGLPLVYDIGSGLLRKPKGLPLENEPDVRSSLAKDADLVCFSCDKLLGGPQAGIVAGKTEYVRKLATAPMMRALRVGKLTLAALSAACRAYLTDERLIADNPTFAMLSESTQKIEQRAEKLAERLRSSGVSCSVVNNQAHVGGGTLPELTVPSKAVLLETPEKAKKNDFAENVFYGLLKLDTPVVSILREGRVLFDVLTVRTQELPAVAEAIRTISEP